MTQTLLKMYAMLVSTLFGIVFSAQILSFLGFYNLILAVPMTLLVSSLAYIIYQRSSDTWHKTLNQHQMPSNLLSKTVIGVSVALVFIIFVQRMILWGKSTLGFIISPDFIGYHGVKALQLYYTGSAWDLSVPYGQYPFGYESLIAFGMFFTGDIRVTGIVHALTFILLWLTIAFLLLRYARLSTDVCLLLALGICFMPIIFPQLMNVGKNDVLSTVLILMAILHAPLGDERFHPIGLAFATMLSLATKSTGVVVLFYLWGLVMLYWGLHWRKGTWREYLHPLVFLLVIVLMFPGGLWVIRNYLVMGELVTSEISEFFYTSIIANLDNPTLYNSPDSRSLQFALVLILGLSIASLFYRQLRWQWAGLLLVITFSFAITPLSAYLTLLDLDYLDVQWRFVLYGVVAVWVTGIILIAPIINRLYSWVNEQIILRRIMSGLLIIAGIGLVLAIGVDDIFSYDATQWEKVIDPDLQDNSIYDELALLEPSTVYLENISWLSVWMNNPDLVITELRYPLGRSEIYPIPDIDYLAFSPRFFDEPLAPIYQTYEWELIFQSSTASLYQRVR